MRILHVLHTSLPHVCGYSLRSDQIITLQRAAGFEIGVVTSAQQPAPNQDEVIDGVRYWRTTCRDPGRSPLRELRLMRALSRSVDAACAEFRPDVVHAHSPVLVGIPARRVARARGLPFVYELRDLWENASVDRGKFRHESIPYRIARGLETRLVRQADAVVTICDALRQNLLARVPREIVVTPNGVDVDAFQPVAVQAEWQAAWNPNKHPTIAYLGAFQPYEGIDVLIRAMPLMTRSSDVRLLVVGDGPERASLEALSQQLGMGERITFTGRIPHARVKEVYAVADLMVYPRIDTLTTRLTTPLKPLEAMAMERAVLASDLPAIRELIVDGQTGALCQPGSPEALAERALALLADPELRKRLGHSARQSVLKDRTWEQSVRRYRAVYEQSTRRR